MIMRGTKDGLFHVGAFCVKPGTLGRSGNHMSLGPAASRGSDLCTAKQKDSTQVWGLRGEILGNAYFPCSFSVCVNLCC